MIKILLSSFLILQFNLILSQEISTEIHGKKINYFISLEKKLKSELFNTGQTYMSLDDSAQPIIYKRKEKRIPDLLVQYSFSKKDSVINKVLYEWDDYNFDKNQNNIKSKKFNKALIEKYKALLKTLQSKYGESKADGSLENLEDIESRDGLNRKDIWKPNDSLEIVMYTAISNYYKKDGAITINPTHRIRLYITNIKKETEPKLDKEIISKANQNFESFLLKLKENNLAEAKLYISNIVVKNITESQLTDLKKDIDFGRKLVAFDTRFQVTMTGIPTSTKKKNLITQYKYVNEGNDVPKTTFKIVFDEECKILGIQTFHL